MLKHTHTDLMDYLVIPPLIFLPVDQERNITVITHSLMRKTFLLAPVHLFEVGVHEMKANWSVSLTRPLSVKT